MTWKTALMAVAVLATGFAAIKCGVAIADALTQRTTAISRIEWEVGR